MDIVAVLPGVDVAPEARAVEIARVSSDSRGVKPGDLFVAFAARSSTASRTSRRPSRAAPWPSFPTGRRPQAPASRGSSSRPRGGPWRSSRPSCTAVRPSGWSSRPSPGRTARPRRRRCSRRSWRGATARRACSRRPSTGRPGAQLEAGRTTPEAPLVQELLAELVADGVPAAAIEVSSHALVLDRVEGCRFDVAVFTNLTRDHLDFHGTMDEYYEAKKRLFAMRKPGAYAVVNVDDLAGRRLLAEVSPPLASYSPSGAAADFRAEATRCDLSGTFFEVVSAGARFSVASPLLGRFQVSNLLARGGRRRLPGRSRVRHRRGSRGRARRAGAARARRGRPVLSDPGRLRAHAGRPGTAPLGGPRADGPQDHPGLRLRRRPRPRQARADGTDRGPSRRHRDRDVRQPALREPGRDPARGRGRPHRLGRDQVPQDRRPARGDPRRRRARQPRHGRSSSPARATRPRSRSGARIFRSTTGRWRPSSRGSREVHARGPRGGGGRAGRGRGHALRRRRRLAARASRETSSSPSGARASTGTTTRARPSRREPGRSSASAGRRTCRPARRRSSSTRRSRRSRSSRPP